MFRNIDDILDVYRTDEYVTDVDGVVGVVDTFDNTAAWYQLYPRSFWFFSGRTSLSWLNRFGNFHHQGAPKVPRT